MAIAALFAYWAWTQGGPRRALLRMPESQRIALYDQARASFESACGKPVDELRDYCTQQAEFLLQFPECDAGCQRRVREVMSVFGAPR